MIVAGLVLMVYTICLGYALKLDTEIQKQKRDMELEKLKMDLQIERMRMETKLSYAEKQRVNFAKGRHWKR